MLIKQNNETTPPKSRVNMLAALAVTVGLVFSALPANAYIPRKDQVNIRVDSVELETQAGVQRVYEYMTQEATDACEFSGMSIRERRFVEKCAADLLEDFVFDLNDKRLIDFHKSQTRA